MNRRLLRSLAAVALVVLALILTFAPAKAETITGSNTTQIAITGSGATVPYPSQIVSCGRQGSVTKVEVTITKYFYGDFQDLDILLVVQRGNAERKEQPLRIGRPEVQHDHRDNEQWQQKKRR